MSQKRLSPNELMDLVQKAAFEYFLNYRHPTAGLVRERSNWKEAYAKNFGPHDVEHMVTIGGTGMGLMALCVAMSRGWISHEEGIDCIDPILCFLSRCSNYHGLFPHWINGENGRPIAFSPYDRGLDSVESAYLFAGLLSVYQYFGTNPAIRESARRISLYWKIRELWSNANWRRCTGVMQLPKEHPRHEAHVMYWHWSPECGFGRVNDHVVSGFFQPGHVLQGADETLIALILGASAPHKEYRIDPDAFHHGWMRFGNLPKATFERYGITLRGAKPYAMGGPAFLSQFSAFGIRLDGLLYRNDFDFGERCRNHARLQIAYCADNPRGFPGYSADCWGITACDFPGGYHGFRPDGDENDDRGVIAPTAALTFMPVSPEESMRAMVHFYYEHPDMWGPCGFTDSVCFASGTPVYSPNYLAIDQLPIVIGIENARTGLLWNLLMSHPDVCAGIERLDLSSPYLNPIEVR